MSTLAEVIFDEAVFGVIKANEGIRRARIHALLPRHGVTSYPIGVKFYTDTDTGVMAADIGSIYAAVDRLKADGRIRNRGNDKERFYTVGNNPGDLPIL